MGSGCSSQKKYQLVKRTSFAVSGRYHILPRRIEDDYDVDTKKVLGTGMNGSVYMACAKDSGKDFAVKTFKLRGITAESKQDLVSEVEIFLKMDHPHVARLLDVYEADSELHLVMECMEGGELFDRIKARRCFSEADAAHCVWQMLLSVHYIHSQGIVHRDLKLENFLFERKENDHLKLIDFGLSTRIWKSESMMAEQCGTLAYMAPEVIKARYGSQCDLWSLGVICFILCQGYLPFPENRHDLQQRQIRSGVFQKRPKWEKLTSLCQDFIQKLLVVDPLQRMTCEDALKHAWIANRDQRGHYRITPLAQLQAESEDDKLNGSELNIDGDTIEALCHFQQASKFRRACMSLMAWSLSQEERATVRNAFIELDVKRKGTIQLAELQQVLHKLDTGKTPESTEKAALLKRLATDASLGSSPHSEEIDYTEFLAAMMTTRICMHDEHLLATFKRFDTDNSGFISPSNLQEVLGSDFDAKELQQLVLALDPENGDQISYEKFVEYLRSGSATEMQKSAAVKIIDSSITGSTIDDSDDDLRRLISCAAKPSVSKRTKSSSCVLQ